MFLPIGVCGPCLALFALNLRRADVLLFFFLVVAGTDSATINANRKEKAHIETRKYFVARNGWKAVTWERRRCRLIKHKQAYLVTQESLVAKCCFSAQ